MMAPLLCRRLQAPLQAQQQGPHRRPRTSPGVIPSAALSAKHPVHCPQPRPNARWEITPSQRRGAKASALIDMEANGNSYESRQPQGNGIVMAEVEAAADAVDRIVKGVVQRMAISEGVAFVAGDKEGEMNIDRAVAEALEDEADALNDIFLAVLMQYADGAKRQGEEDMSNLLAKIYEATIQFVTDRMPAEMVILTRLSEEPSSQAREQILRSAVSGGDGDVPKCDLETLARTGNRMVEDMESRKVVPDRNLLIRLCLIREEVCRLALERDDMEAPEILKFSSVVPGRVSHFIKRESKRRMALLEKVFRGDWEGAAAQNRTTQKERINKSKFGSPEDDIPDVVRPGSLLATLMRLQMAMEADKAKVGINKKKIQRVAEIRHEAVHVMKRIAFD